MLGEGHRFVYYSIKALAYHSFHTVGVYIYTTMICSWISHTVGVYIYTTVICSWLSETLAVVSRLTVSHFVFTPVHSKSTTSQMFPSP